MTVVYGLSSAGFVPKPLTVIRDDLGAALRSAFGASIKLGDKSIFGQIVGIFAEALSKLWEQAEAVHSSQDPNKANGASLDAVSSLTGTYRPAASYSTVVCTLFGTPASPVATGTQFKTTSTGKTFATSENVTIALAPPWAASTAYAIGNRVFSNINRIYECIVAGTSHATTPVSGLGSDIVDGTVHWKLIADNNPSGGVVDATCLATETGSIEATAGDITTIVTPVAGLQQVVNLADAAPGRTLATDEELRILREEELSGDGQTPQDAIRAALLRISGVETATVFMNLSDFVDADGMPPHSVEALVRTTWAPGDAQDQLIYNALQKNVAAGIVTTGTTTGSALDSEGVSHVIKFSRPTNKLIYVALVVIVESLVFPTDGANLIKDAIVAWGDRQNTGKDAVTSAIGARAFEVDGVLDVTSCFIDLAPAPTTSTTIAVSKREIAVYDTSRITISTTPGEP